MALDDQPAHRSRSLFAGLSFGIIFGFLLQKGGVADYEVLIGALRLTDSTVFTVILTAIVVGSVASAVLRRFGLARAHPKPTHYASNIVGGLLFGVGFGLLGYCPGTGAAARSAAPCGRSGTTTRGRGAGADRGADRALAGELKRFTLWLPP